MANPTLAEPDIATLAASLMREPRLAKVLEIKIWGIDVDKKIFSQGAHTIDISRLGARLSGMKCQLALGDIVFVQYALNKARCRVVWQGEKGSSEEGSLGLVCLDEIFCPWISCIPIAMSGTAADSDVTVRESWPKTDRRRYPRFRCAGNVRVSKAGDTMPTTAKMTDIGMGGCYMEIMSPWPVGTVLDAVVSVGGFECAATATVRTAHSMMGNGLEFTTVTPENKLRLERLLSNLSSALAAKEGERAKTPEPQPSFAPQVVQAEAKSPTHPLLASDVEERLEALLALLSRRGVISREDFEEELLRKTKPN